MKRFPLFAFAALSLSAANVFAQPVPMAPQPGIPAPGQPLPRTDPNGVYCREYTQQVMIGGVRRSSYGTACQQPDGSWKIVTTDQQPQPDAPVQYIGAPQYLSPPTYVVPPVAYYEPYPYYAPYPYYGGGISVGIGFHDGYHGYHHYR